MEIAYSKTILFVISTLLFIHTVSAILCYECNSNREKEETCKNVLPEERLLVNCTAKKYGERYNLCRTIRQWVDFKVGILEKDERVIRLCGRNQTGERASYYKAGFGGRQRVNTCYEDKCNDAPRVTVTSFGIAASAAVLCLLHVHW